MPQDNDNGKEEKLLNQKDMRDRKKFERRDKS